MSLIPANMISQPGVPHITNIGQGLKVVEYGDSFSPEVPLPYLDMLIRITRTATNDLLFYLPNQENLPFTHGLYFFDLNGEADVTLSGSPSDLDWRINGSITPLTFSATTPPTRSLVALYNGTNTWRTFHLENFTSSIPWNVVQGPIPIESITSLAVLPVPANAISITNPMDYIGIEVAYRLNVGGIGDFVALSWTQPPLSPGPTSIKRCPTNVIPGDGICKAILYFNQSGGIVNTDADYLYGTNDDFEVTHDTQTNLDLTLPWNIVVGTSGIGVLGMVYILKYNIFKA
jgi:hypothetical protein